MLDYLYGFRNLISQGLTIRIELSERLDGRYLELLLGACFNIKSVVKGWIVGFRDSVLIGSLWRSLPYEVCDECLERGRKNKTRDANSKPKPRTVMSGKYNVSMMFGHDTFKWVCSIAYFSCCSSCDIFFALICWFHSYCCLYLVNWPPSPHTVWVWFPVQLLWA